MIITCPHCKKQHNIDEKRIPPKVKMARCQGCGQQFPLDIPRGEPSPSPLQPAAIKTAPARAPGPTTPASQKTRRIGVSLSKGGVGKTTTARLLAKAINCPNRPEGKFEPCDNCESCREISQSHSIDVIEIDAASHTGVDNVRENIIDNAQFRPTKSKYKIFIMDEAHMLSTAAFNALLKILEEPPEYVVFVLATTELHKLPETIVSRCQRFGFKKVGFDIMKKHLEKIAKEENIKIDKEVVERIINKSDSCVRDAISLLDQIMATGEKNITGEVASIVLPSSNVSEIIQFISYILNKNASNALKQINKLADEGINLSQFTEDIVELLRVMMVTKAGATIDAGGLDLSKDTEKAIAKLNKDITATELINLIDLLMRRRLEIKSSPIPQMPLELAIVEWSESGVLRPETGDRRDDDNEKDGDNNIETEKQKNIETKEEPAEKRTIKERVKDLISKEPSFSLSDVENKWNEVIKQIEEYSASLSFILKNCSLKNISGNTLIISTDYSLHWDKLTDKTHQKEIESVLSEVLEEKAKIEVIIKSKNTDEKKKVENELQELTAAFGGEVIN